MSASAGSLAPGSGRRERFFTLPVLTLVALSFILGMSEFIIVGILPDIAHGLSVSEVSVGNLVSLFAFVYAPATPLGSALSCRFPRFATHLALALVFLAGNIMCAFAVSFAMLVASRVVIALVSGTLVALSMTYAPDVTSERYRTMFISWVFSGFSIASVLGVPVGTWVANTFGWRWSFHLIDLLTVAVIVLMLVALPRNSHTMRIGFLAQFRLFFDRRIQLGVLDVVFGAAASYVFYTYLTPIMRDEIHMPEHLLSFGLVVFGVACLWSNLYSGRLASRGRGIEPLTHIRPVYALQTMVLCSLALTGIAPWYGAVALVVLGMLMYLQNASSQVLYMDVASSAHPGSLNLASSLNSMSFNTGIALGSAAGGLVNDRAGLLWLGPAGAVFALLAVGTATMLKRQLDAGNDRRAAAEPL
ncbi:MFS transporter [Bifidobacterium sp.]|jgi:predicted MFS family arabinose efflux permease|uniref:MFS transporter n=1 Tax=Bifidobacterium sp. TaxID=41200 RepID=UPI0025C26CA4|nr:MFS transporter [Bifidobacterium sp.]MCH4209283.1 MFS transporter [Bifidobacterium sp.]MCI1224077.1 MFS transporter [Bifidobacterium sp.]